MILFPSYQEGAFFKETSVSHQPSPPQEAGGNFPYGAASGVISLAGDYPCTPSLGMPFGRLCPAGPGGASLSWLMESYST